MYGSEKVNFQESPGHQLFHGLGGRDLTEQKVNDAELFVCKLYKISDKVRSSTVTFVC